jgi:hypothetical protein
VVVAPVFEHVQAAVARRDDGDVQRAAAEVEDEPPLVAHARRGPVSDGRRYRLLQ